MEKRRTRSLIFVLALFALVGAACCSDSDEDSEPSSDDGATDAQNACPTDGCTVSIVDVAAAGDELEITWDANFDPDVSKNHIHVYWDTFTADQVSNDAADRGVEQGEWVPTDADPSFVTEGAVSTAVAGESTTICVTAADRDHNVLDADIGECRDVAELMAG